MDAIIKQGVLKKHTVEQKPSAGVERLFILRRRVGGDVALMYYAKSADVSKEPKGTILLPDIVAVQTLYPHHHLGLGTPASTPRHGMGVVRYFGPHPQDGSEVAGVELEGPTGDCDGSLNGQRLFQCRPKHGVFVPADSITAVRLVLQAMSPAKKEAEESFTLHLRLSRRTDKHKRTELLLTAPSHAEMVSWHFALSRAAFHDSPKSLPSAHGVKTLNRSPDKGGSMMPAPVLRTFQEHPSFTESGRADVEMELLAEPKPGLFLLRPSSLSPEAIALSLVVLPDKVDHHVIEPRGQGFSLNGIMLPLTCDNPTKVIRFLSEPQHFLKWPIPLSSFIDSRSGVVWAV